MISIVIMIITFVLSVIITLMPIAFKNVVKYIFNFIEKIRGY